MNSAYTAMTKEEWIKEIEEQTLLELAEFDTLLYDDATYAQVEIDHTTQS